MKIVFTSSEIAPFVKTGGLADVAGSLPKYINTGEFEIIALIPMYGSISRNEYQPEFTGILEIPHAGGTVQAGISRTHLPGSSVKVYLIEHEMFLRRDGIYGEKGTDYPDNDSRFSFYCRAVIEICKFLGFQPDVIHCNDWQTGLIPVYLRTLYSDDKFFSRTRVLFTVHNLAYMGLFDPASAVGSSGLPWSVFSMHGVEFYGRFSFLKAGLYYSDSISTVSPSYSLEIQTEDSGMGLHGLLSSRSASLSGILNGLDYEVWDPSTDPVIKKNYNVSGINDRMLNKEWLRTVTDLDPDESRPVIAMVTRLTEQKGIDLVAEVADELMKRELSLVILGTGEEYYHNIFAGFAVRYYGRMSIMLRYDDELAHLIYAGSDMFLMPSRFEPCGISQLISLRYGSVPVVRKTGGLSDTVTGYNGQLKNLPAANGFVFADYTADSLLECIDLALELFRNKSSWRTLMVNGMNCDFSWNVSARKYEALYRRLHEMNW